MNLKQSTQNSADVIIIGGGVIGLLSARELAKAGAQVILLEKQALGRESSWAGGGILSPLYPWRVADAITTLCGWSQQAYPALAAELLAATGVDPEWRRSGLLISDCEDLGQALAWRQKHGAKLEVLTPLELQRIAPGLGLAPAQPLFMPDVGQVRNPRLLRALRMDLEQRGARLLEQHPVQEIQAPHGKITGVSTPQGWFSAPRYVVTAGAWSGALAGEIKASGVDIAPVKGQMLIYGMPPGLLPCMVLHQGHYLIPRQDGRILVGSTVEHTHFDKSTTDLAYAELTAFAHAVLPALRGCEPERHWAGLRPGSPEGVPLIGAHPKIENLYFNCGHFRNGFVMAPASTRLLADLMLGRPPILPPEPYRIGI
jgi:glycine oxidase